MLGFGKKKNNPPEKVNPQAGSSGDDLVGQVSIPDDKFVVMPKQYLSQQAKESGPTHGINKKIFLFGAPAFIILVVLGFILYVNFFSAGQDSKATIKPPQQSAVQDEEPDFYDNSQKEDNSEKTQEKIITSQAYNDLNVLVGSLRITAPPTVVQKFASSMGVTVLNQDDLLLPEQGSIVGGLYSIYPNGVTLEEPISVEIFVSNMPQGSKPQDIYPAYLRGVTWQEFDDYQLSLGSFNLMIEKLPSGPVGVVWNPQEQSEPSDPLEPSKPHPSKDTDSDGLTDSEEHLFGTSQISADSDEDSYLDLEEIINGYNPVLAAGSRLSDAGVFTLYTNATYGYSVSYPINWLADSLDQTNKQVLFISNTEEFFEILVEENPLNTPIVDWYRAQSPSLKTVELDVAVLSSRPAVWSPDGLTLYTAKDGLIYIITYNIGTRDEISWPNVFDYFYKSFVFGNVSNAFSAPDGGIGTTTQEDM